MKVALLWHGNRDARSAGFHEFGRFGATADGLRAEGIHPEAAVYHDDFADEVKDQILAVEAVLIWVNPITEDGNDRTKLDAMLAEVAATGVFVSAHPKTIQKMGTKDVLLKTKGLGWGSDVFRYDFIDQLRNELPLRLANGKSRVLKRMRGHSGQGVWKVTQIAGNVDRVLARHAQRGAVEKEVSVNELFEILEPYFSSGAMIDQPFNERIVDGMIRCYQVHDRVAGFGHQKVNALHPAEQSPGERLYFPVDEPQFQAIRQRMDSEWLPEMMRVLGMHKDELPLLWDADFMFGPSDGEFVLCEINVSSVYPYPEPAIQPLARALRERLNI